MSAITRKTKLFYWGGSLSLGVLNFIFPYICAAFLVKNDFGRLQTLIGTLTIAGLLASALQSHITYRVANAKYSYKIIEPLIFAYTSAKILFRLVTALPVLFFLGLKASGSVNLLECLLLIMGWLLFLAGSISNALTSAYKLLDAQILANLAGAVFKVLMALAIFYFVANMPLGFVAYFSAFPILVLWSLLAISRSQSNCPLPDATTCITSDKPVEPNYLSLSIFVGSFSLGIPLLIDQIFVQHLQHQVSGDYAAATMLSKAIFALLSPMVSMFYCEIVQISEFKLQLKSLRHYLALSLTLALPTVLFICLFEDFTVATLLPSKYIALNGVVSLLSVATLLHMLGILGQNLFVARGSWFATISMALVITLQFLGFSLAQDLKQIAIAQLLSGAASTVITFGLLVYESSRSKRF